MLELSKRQRIALGHLRKEVPILKKALMAIESKPLPTRVRTGLYGSARFLSQHELDQEHLYPMERHSGQELYRTLVNSLVRSPGRSSLRVFRMAHEAKSNSIVY